MKVLLLLALIIPHYVFAKNYLDDNLRRLKWNEMDVIWLEDDSYPTYSINVYFNAGALLDEKGKYGQTELAFKELTSGTTRYTRQEIVDSLEFYGASYGANVTHEYTTFSVEGLVKDMLPTMKMICHTFQNASYPVEEFNTTKKRLITALKNSVTDHSGLANRIFREVSLQGTQFSKPVSGNIRSINSLTAKDLHDRMLFFNNEVQKRIYIKGPKAVKELESVFVNDCGWKQGQYKNEIAAVTKTPENNNIVYLVPVPKANQAQIRIGRYITKEESHYAYELQSLAARHMGGGFTSRLMQELRVKRGLTYSVGAYISSQAAYGRSGITTFTKNETLVETFNVTKEVINNESTATTEENFHHIKRFIKGNYLLGLESTSAFLETLLFFDHIGRDYKEIYQFSNKIDQISIEQMQSLISQIFGFDNQIRLVVGDKNLDKQLAKAGYKVKVLNYNDYL
jgi:zinc protease